MWISITSKLMNNKHGEEVKYKGTMSRHIWYNTTVMQIENKRQKKMDILIDHGMPQIVK